MSIITDYASLKQSILDFTHRGDLSTYLDYFIQNAQEQINTDIAEQNMGNYIKAMEVALPSNSIDSSGHVPVPSDYLAMKTFEVIIGNGQIENLIQKSADWIYNTYPNRVADNPPTYFAREGSNFIFGPFPDSGYATQGWYYQLAALLSGSQTTNWMVLKAPWMLHAQCMVQAMKFLVNSDGVALWTATYQDKLTALINADKAERWNASTLQMEVA